MRPIVLAFLVLNTAVFGLWLVLGESPIMVENFLVSWDGLMAGRYWTLLTSEFSHLLFLHFFLNMYVLASFGPIVEHTIGSTRFLMFYVLAAIVASVSHAAVSAFLLNKPELPALGASGAISGVILLFSFLYPRARLLLFGFIPMPALVGAFAFVGLDVAGLIWQVEGGGLPIGHGAHLGGAITGILYYLLVIRPLELRQAARVDFGDVATWRRLIARQDKTPDDQTYKR
ncbi:MAG: rhomboid family intramembrane serine protease [Alphaproteobacteria bacterium]|nr:rhomboid family intramembrane serine protease [Alphaproteobacteria bacterium]